jgi:hypothetical protein
MTTEYHKALSLATKHHWFIESNDEFSTLLALYGKDEWYRYIRIYYDDGMVCVEDN